MGSQACAARTGLYRCSAPLPQVSEGDEARDGEEARADEEDPSVGQTRLQEPEDNEIRTVHAGDTPYTSAASFEDLPISGLLLQVASIWRWGALSVRLQLHRTSAGWCATVSFCARRRGCTRR